MIIDSTKVSEGLLVRFQFETFNFILNVLLGSHRTQTIQIKLSMTFIKSNLCIEIDLILKNMAVVDIYRHVRDL